ncbi:hypothetical protein ACOMHN_030761 [Nucella lapillus]
MWGMDFTMLPKSDEGHNYLVVAVDYLSKYVEAAPLKIKEAPAILTFFDNICSRFGFPKVVITDQGREFCNQLFEDYCNVNGISHRTSTAYHPQCGGEGHKRGDLVCQLAERSQSKEPAPERQQNTSQQQDSPKEQMGIQGAQSTASAKPVDSSQKGPKGSKDDRSRPLSRQTSIVSALKKQDRKRSATPNKRSRSREGNDSEWEREGKMTRRDNQRDGSPPQTDWATTGDGEGETNDTLK